LNIILICGLEGVCESGRGRRVSDRSKAKIDEGGKRWEFIDR